MPDYVSPFAPVKGAQRTAYAPRRRYSVTADILSFRRCRRQYGREAVHGYAPSRTSQFFYGTVIHQVLDRAHAHFHGLIDPATKGKVPSDEEIREYFEDVRQSLRTRGIRGARPKVEDQALEVIQLFNRVEGPTLYPRVIDSEHRMQADEDTYVLHGTADLLLAPNDVDRSPGALELWDYKGQRRPSPANRHFQDYLFQMRVYADLYRRRHGVYPARTNLYFLNELYALTVEGGKPLEQARSSALLTVEIAPLEVADALTAFRTSVAEIERQRALDDWAAPAVGDGPGKETCTICDHRWNCPTVRDDPELSSSIPMRYP